MKIKIINTTTNSSKNAHKIAELLIKKKLSPCVHIINHVESYYKWESKIEKTVEKLLIIKTIPEKLEDCKGLILKYHNYDTPELILLDGKIILNEYRKWFRDFFNN